MLSPAELAWMRDQQEQLMLDRVTVERPGEAVWDPVAEETRVTFDPVYAGKGRIALLPGEPTVTASGELVTPQTAYVTVPYGSTPAPGDRVTVTDPRPGVPPVVWVQAVETPGIVATACRMQCGARS